MNDKTPEALAESGDTSRLPPIEKWWIAVNGQAEGPHTASYLALQLTEGRINTATKVCPVGAKAWISLGDAKSLVAAVRRESPAYLPPTLPNTEVTMSRTFMEHLARFTNPALPRFANWIGVYAMLVLPAFTAIELCLLLTGFNNAAELRDESPILGHAIAIDTITFMVDLALTIVFFIGGLQLRKLRPKGVLLLKAGLVLSLFWGAVSMLFGLIWGAIVTLAEQEQPTSEEVSLGAVLLFLLVLLVCLVLVIFELVALVWLINNEHRLPLITSDHAHGDMLRSPVDASPA